jgi:uncharacterized damage-inducible protein DinB
MKKLLMVTTAIALFSFVSAPATLTKEERNFATKFLKDTEKGVFEKYKGLSDAQLTYKPAPDRWSVEECLKHIASTEQALWQMTEGNIKQAANPDKRSEIKMTDEQVIKMIESREKKVQTQDQFKPENTPFKTAADAIESFKANRDKLIAYVKTTDEDLRNHVVTMPFGQLDTYQMILFIGAHSNRHTQQIAEVMADPGFPKN